MKRFLFTFLWILTTTMLFSQSVYDNPLMNSEHTIPVALVNKVMLNDPYQIEPIAETLTTCPKCGKSCWKIWGKLYDRTSYGSYVNHECTQETPIGDAVVPLMVATVIYIIYTRLRLRYNKKMFHN